jgi:membrane protein insertase Oxa1/YidC/SpoIIIJ
MCKKINNQMVVMQLPTDDSYEDVIQQKYKKIKCNKFLSCYQRFWRLKIFCCFFDANQSTVCATVVA